jgi:arginase
VLQNIQIVHAPSILGLRPGGVELLGTSLIDAGLAHTLQRHSFVEEVPTKNHHYNSTRDLETGCLNPSLLRDFSSVLADVISRQISRGNFPLVLGGDCSILLGVMSALKREGEYGLIFLDAHADYYLPPESPTGEVADMDLAIVTGRGPDMLTNIDGLKPYVTTENVIHVGQRDAAEIEKFGSLDISDTSMHCFDLENIRAGGLANVLNSVLSLVSTATHKGYWLHFDTDVLSDDENPAVDYRLPGGISFGEAETMLRSLVSTGKVVGMTITIFNPRLDKDGSIARKISQCLTNALRT